MRDFATVLFFGVVASFPGYGECLRITDMKVPRLLTTGNRVSLSCSFELTGEQLYSLSWWRNDDIFFNYKPGTGSSRPSVFNVAGITVDGSSTFREVILSRVDHRASGTIRCEVIVMPSFEKATMEKNMTVIAEPTKGPSITGHQGQYHIGDLLLLNCSSPPSYPPTILSWDIDGRKASMETVILYPGEADSLGRVSSWSGLQMWLNHGHFARGMLILRCTASILNHYNKSSEVAITNADNIELPKERASTGGAEMMSVALFLLLLLLLANLAT